MSRPLLVLWLAALAAIGWWIHGWQSAAISRARAQLAVRSVEEKESPAQASSGLEAQDRPASPELLRLRGEVAVLRRQVEEFPHPAGASDAQRSNDWQLVYSGERPSQHPDFIQWSALAKVGSATPEAALQSFHYAMSHQEKEPMTNTRMKDLWDVPDDYDQPPGYNIDLGEGFYGGVGYRIVQRESLATNVVQLTIDYEKQDGSSYRRDKVLVESGGRWRVKPASVTRPN